MTERGASSGIRTFDMTLSHFSTRSGALVAAVLASTALLFGAPAAHAAPKGAYYEVQLAEASPAKKAIIRGVVFQCEGNVCRAPIIGSLASSAKFRVSRRVIACCSLTKWRIATPKRRSISPAIDTMQIQVSASLSNPPTLARYASRSG
jgi:hypothetical protein